MKKTEKLWKAEGRAEVGNKNIFILIFAFLLVVLLTASTSALIMSGMIEEPVNICVVLEDSSSGRWSSFIAGLEQAAKDRGVKLTLVPTTKTQTLSQQYALIKDAMSDGADGVILQASSSRGTENMITDISSKVALVLVDTDVDTDVDVEGKSAVIEANNIEIGRALANEIRINLGNDLSGYSIGIVAGNQRQKSMKLRYEGFLENIESSGANIVWNANYTGNAGDRIDSMQEENRADVLVALDNSGLEALCEHALRKEEKPYIFGEGTSIKNVSYLDDGLISSMVVPNEYYMGYQSVVAISKRLDNRLTPMENEIISYRIINRESLFDEENQRLLFPVAE